MRLTRQVRQVGQSAAELLRVDEGGVARRDRARLEAERVLG